MLALEQARGECRDPAEHLAVRIDDVPASGMCRIKCARREPGHCQVASPANQSGASPLSRLETSSPPLSRQHLAGTEHHVWGILV